VAVCRVDRLPRRHHSSDPPLSLSSLGGGGGEGCGGSGLGGCLGSGGLDTGVVPYHAQSQPTGSYRYSYVCISNRPAAAAAVTRWDPG
jgi:hypothetical protein